MCPPHPHRRTEASERVPGGGQPPPPPSWQRRSAPAWQASAVANRSWLRPRRGGGRWLWLTEHGLE
ncbi:MAG: hypothetical protein ACK53Y_27190, partial [bacterium]